MGARKYYCFVPGCPNTSVKFPNKIFISVPQKENVRRLWLKASRRDMLESPISPKCNLTCCEDHFEMENDIENWSRYKFYKEAGFKANIRLKKGVLPHKFHCQEGRTVTSTVSSVVENLERKKLINDILSAGNSTSRTEQVIIPVVESEDEEVSCHRYLSRETQTDHSNMADRSVQVTIKAHVRSKFAQTEQVQNNDESCPVDVSTQMTPQKKNRLECSSEEATQSMDCDGSEWNVQSSSSNEEIEEVKNEILNDKALEVSLHQIEAKPNLNDGITTRYYSIMIENISEHTGCLPRNVTLVLQKIKFNASFDSLGFDFGISGRQASRVFQQSLPKIAEHLRQQLLWPPPEVIEELLPVPFRCRYRKVQSIIYCFEVLIEKPSDPEKQCLTWSEYHKANTLKYLVSAIPDGFINFISKGFGGRTTDTDLIKHCGYLDCLSDGMEVMADREFQHLASSLEARGVKLVMPPSVRSGTKLEKTETMTAKIIDSLSIHKEHVIGRIRCNKMLSQGNMINKQLIQYLDSVVLVVGGLLNLSELIFHE